MRWLSAVLVLAQAPSGSTSDGGTPAAFVEKARDCSDVPLEPSLGLAKYKQVGTCRYEVRKGSACCLVRFDSGKSGSSVIPGKQVDIDDDLVIASDAASRRAFEPSLHWMRSGDRFVVCGETVVCSP